jgi:hypothetical protein
LPGYRTWATGDIPSAADWNNLHADPLSADVTANEASAATTYGDLTTVGPFVTLNLVAGQKVVVLLSCYASTATDGIEQFMSFAVSGASSLAAADANAAHSFSIKVGTNTAQTPFRATVYTATSTGSHTFTAKYKTTAATPNWKDRRIIVKSF